MPSRYCAMPWASIIPSASSMAAPFCSSSALPEVSIARSCGRTRSNRLLCTTRSTRPLAASDPSHCDSNSSWAIRSALCLWRASCRRAHAAHSSSAREARAVSEARARDCFSCSSRSASYLSRSLRASWAAVCMSRLKRASNVGTSLSMPDLFVGWSLLAARPPCVSRKFSIWLAMALAETSESLMIPTYASTAASDEATLLHHSLAMRWCFPSSSTVCAFNSSSDSLMCSALPRSWDTSPIRYCRASISKSCMSVTEARYMTTFR
mmetsp:Transcript_37802/g.84459  ORF Transcript_37802/g.84459 Transcript_37802/m.84459 type:complete len:266 (+) Transcript_37802:529-1326(+)